MITTCWITQKKAPVRQPNGLPIQRYSTVDTMKKLLTTIILCLTVLFAIGQELPKYDKPKQSKESPHVWNVTYMKSGRANQIHTQLVYRSYSDLVAGKMEDSKLQMWSEERLKEEIGYLPKGGLLLFIMRRNNIRHSDPENVVMVVKDSSGADLGRYTFETKMPYKMEGVWYYNSAGVPVLEEMPKEFTVYLIDNLHNKRFEFLVKQ